MSILDKLVKAVTVWKNAKAQQKEEGHISRNKEELEFLPAALEVIETPPSPTARFTVWLILILFMLAIIWAILGKTDVVITATGKIIPSGRSKVVQPLEGGIIRKIHVEEGQFVNKGDIIIELDPTNTTADQEQIKDSLIQAVLNASRAKAFIENPSDPMRVFNPPSIASRSAIETQRLLLKAQFEEHKSRIKTLQSSIDSAQADLRGINAEVRKLNKTIPLVRKRVNSMVELARQGLAPRNSSLQLEQELVESEENIQVLRHRRSKIEASLESTKKQLNQADQEFNKQNIATLAEAQKQVTSLRQDLIKTKERVRLQKLRAPTDGYVQQLQISTVGGVVQPAQQLMFIVPQDEVLEVEAMVLNKDRGSIKVNQEAEVKLEAFNFTKHGTIGAVIRNISSDAVQDEKLGAVFPVRVSLLQNYIMVNDEKIRLTPGLNVTLEAKDSKRRVIEFILTPILKGFKEAAREK